MTEQEPAAFPYIPIDEFVALSGGRITQNMVRESVRRGTIPHIRLGQRKGILIARDALARMEAQQEAERLAALQRMGG